MLHARWTQTDEQIDALALQDLCDRAERMTFAAAYLPKEQVQYNGVVLLSRVVGFQMVKGGVEHRLHQRGTRWM